MKFSLTGKVLVVKKQQRYLCIDEESFIFLQLRLFLIYEMHNLKEKRHACPKIIHDFLINYLLGLSFKKTDCKLRCLLPQAADNQYSQSAVEIFLLIAVQKRGYIVISLKYESPASFPFLSSYHITRGDLTALQQCIS